MSQSYTSEPWLLMSYNEEIIFFVEIPALKIGKLVREVWRERMARWKLIKTFRMINSEKMYVRSCEGTIIYLADCYIKIHRRSEYNSYIQAT